MNKTKIEWVKNPDGSQGYTWNPITGCLNGCPYCYAAKLARGRLKRVYKALNSEGLPKGKVPDYVRGERLTIAATDPFYPRFWPERLGGLEDRHTHNNRFSRPIGVFVCDMSDLFGIGVPEEWTRRVLDVICSQMSYPAEKDRFYLLTKQPQNLHNFSPFPENCWVGVTATNQEMYDGAVYHLHQIEATIKYISIEPFLSRIHVPNYKDVDWLILGSQTNPYLCPQSEWIGDILIKTYHTGTLIFLKDNLYMIKPKRQEMPK